MYIKKKIKAFINKLISNEKIQTIIINVKLESYSINISSIYCLLFIVYYTQ